MLEHIRQKRLGVKAIEAPSYPTPPDPAVTAAAQTASNKETAVANANLNRFDQNSPQGSVKYTVVGTNADGTPKYQQDTTYSPEFQKLFDNQTGIAAKLGDFGLSQGSKVADLLSNPFDPNAAAEDKIVALQKARLDPQWSQQEEGLRNQLINSGMRPGTEAYDREMANFSQRKQDAYNSMYLQGRQQAVSEAQLQRSVPLNELMGVMSGTQVANPTFTPTAGVSQANTDVAGITQAGFQNQMSLYNAQNSQNNAMMGGLFGLGGAALSAFSDRRLKRDIVRVGALPSGLPVYTYTYVWSDKPEIGVMADEAREMFPEAVSEISGFLAVDYGKVR